MVWYGMVWYGMVWYGMVWYGIVLQVPHLLEEPQRPVGDGSGSGVHGLGALHQDEDHYYYFYYYDHYYC